VPVIVFGHNEISKNPKKRCPMSKDKGTKSTFNMAKYNESSSIHESCKGCRRTFEHVYAIPKTDVVITTEKCLVYPNPASKWPGKEKYATMAATVRETDSKGRITTAEKEIPIIDRVCPLASHIVRREIIDTSSKTRAGQQRHK
jgi:hypothetical protein